MRSWGLAPSAATTARRLAREGHDVTFIARGAHLAALREKGMQIKSPVLGDFVARARAEEDTGKIGPVDLAVVAVKAYDNADGATAALKPLVGPETTVSDSAERRRQRRRGGRDRR